MKIPFTYALHDNYQSDEMLEVLQDEDPRFTEELVEKMGRPFYEVIMQCEVDSETGDVTILSAK